MENITFDLSKLTILNKINSGVYGNVYKVRCNENGNIYAAKILLQSFEDCSEEYIKNIKREINIISKINHPLILKFIGFSITNFQQLSNPVIITEYINNGTLKDLIKSKNNRRIKYYWNDTRKLIIIYGIAASLSYLHSQKIIHRDLKPENILIDEYLFPKIADFGFSKIKHENPESISYLSNDYKGTPIYMSPEIWSNKEYSEASDIYAFAFIVYQIMTEETSFKNLNIMELLSNIRAGNRPEFNVAIPKSYRSLIESCWLQNANERPNFNSILTNLKTDPGFITDTVNQQDFINFIMYIDKIQANDETKEQFLISKFKKVDLNQKEIQFDNLNEMFSYGMKLDKGDGVQVDKEEAIFYIKLAADNGQIDAMNYYAMKLKEGDGVIKNMKKSAQYFKMAADKGQAMAMFNYGMMIYNGQIEQTEKNEDIKYIKMAADNGCINAMNFYGWMLRNGDGVNIDKVESFNYFKKAADKGDIESMKICAWDLFSGNEIEMNKDEASKYYKMAADKGDVDSMVNYSNMLFDGDGIPVNKEESAVYCKMAADRGDVDAIYNYAMKLKNGDGIPINKEEAVHYFKMASEKDHIDSLFNYAQMLLDGNGIQSNKEKAIKYMEMAAEKGQIDSINIFKIGAENGDFRLMFLYGMLLFKGNGVQVNKKKGLKYIRMSAYNRFEPAINFYTTLLMDGRDTFFDKQEALRLYKITNNKEKIDELNHLIHKIESLTDFEILNRQIKKPNIKKGFIKVTKQPIVAKYADKNKINRIKAIYKNLINCCHPSIQKVIGFFNPLNSDFGVLITPYYKNSSLNKCLESNILNDCNNEIILGICTAMKYLEENNMFHGDLKPSNILLDDNFCPIINNIQMKSNYTDTEINQPELFINYFAPEVIRGENISIKSDVYSFGLLINTILTKKIPYLNLQSKIEIIYSICNEKIKISNENPKIEQIILNCLDHDPAKRPSFRQLYNELEKIFSDDSINDYKNDIISQIICPITFYRVPKIIAMQPDYLLSNQNEEQISNFILTQNIESLFQSINDEQSIKIIMVCGKYQSGKSTFLRTLTGNGAFYSGIGERSTTQGVLMDGPYSIDNLIERIGIEEFKSCFPKEEYLNLEDNPAIFIIDSQGIGDEIERDQEKILKRILSFFCSLSDLVINITESGEDKNILKKTINIIRQSQMLKFNNNKFENNKDYLKEITKIIFLVKKVNEMNKRPKNSKMFFEKVQQRFSSDWYSYHKVISDLYITSLTKAFPLTNLIYYPLNYCCSVWNTIPDIIKLINTASPKTKLYIRKMINEVSNAILTKFVNKLCENEKNLTTQIDLIVRKTINIIKFQIEEYISENITRYEAINSISSIINGIVNVIIPLTIAQNTNINFQDKNQYIYGLKKDINIHLKANLPELEEYLNISYYEMSLNNLKFGDYFMTAISSLSILLLNPFTDVVAVAAVSVLVIVGYIIVLMIKFTKKSIRENRLKSVAQRRIRLSIPLLWDKKNDKSISIRKLNSVDSVKNLSFFTFWMNDLVIVLESTKSNFMKFIIQSMTGIKCDYEIENSNEKESILYGPISKSFIMERIIRDISHFNFNNYTENILILYLRGYDENDLKQIENIQSKASFFMSSEKSLIHLPTIKNKIIHMFYSIQNQDIVIAKKQDCLRLHEKMSKSIINDDFQIFTWPVLVKDINKIDEIGPLTNKCLRFAFHKIFDKNNEE